VFQTPLSDALDVRLAFEVIQIFGFVPPAVLRLAFAGLAALGFGTEALPRHVTVVGSVKRFAV
jgi:hypothetical protein